VVGSNSDWEFQIKSQIKRRYTRQALEDDFRPNSATRMKELGYSQDMISLLPDELQGAFSGCGCPISDLTFAGNEVVIDLGCGAGIDGFIASKLVPSGVVISVDFTFEMLKILQNNAQGTPVNILASDVESLPLRSEIADYAISNAVFNLTPNKDMAYREMHRILKPRGRIALCDLVCNGELPREILEDPLAHTTSLGGVVDEDKMRSALEAAGFVEIKIKNHSQFSVVVAVMITAQRKESN
jgi:SAM-dependent methyltransferase